MGQARRRHARELQTYETALAAYHALAVRHEWQSVVQSDVHAALQRHLVDANGKSDVIRSSQIFYDLVSPFSERWPGNAFSAVEQALGLEIRLVAMGLLRCRGLHGVTLFANGRGCILIDRMADSEIDLTDTLFHELVHATGPKCGRWEWSEQPSMFGGLANPRYVQEEPVAVFGALALHTRYGYINPKPEDLLFRRSAEALAEHLNVDICDYDLRAAMQEAVKAVAMI